MAITFRVSPVARAAAPLQIPAEPRQHGNRPALVLAFVIGLAIALALVLALVIGLALALALALVMLHRGQRSTAGAPIGQCPGARGLRSGALGPSSQLPTLNPGRAFDEAPSLRAPKARDFGRGGRRAGAERRAPTGGGHLLDRSRCHSTALGRPNRATSEGGRWPSPFPALLTRRWLDTPGLETAMLIRSLWPLKHIKAQ